MPTWRDDKILELANQLTYSPADKRREQLKAAIGLAPTIEAARTYPWDFVHFRITGFQSRQHSEHTINGKVLRADLATLIEFLSDTLSITVEEAGTLAGEGGGVMTVEEVTRRFTVSSKTIQRWRTQGLFALRCVYPDERRRLGFLESAVRAFAEANRERVESAAAFQQLGDQEKGRIIALARQLAAHGMTGIKEISRAIARQMERSPETVRYTIRKYDREHPEAAVLGTDESANRRIGEPASGHAPAEASSTAEGGCATLQERARRIKGMKIEWVGNPLFEHPDAENIILRVLPAEALARAQTTVSAGVNAKAGDVYMARIPRDLPPFLREVFLQPVMPQELEMDAFRRMNYVKWRAARLQAGLMTEQATEAEMGEIEALLESAHQIKNQLVQANLRVAVHVARKHQRADRPLMELVSDATVWLMRAAERYDFTKPARFSTYASLAIMKNFARDRAEALTRREAHVLTGQEETLRAVGAPPEATGETLDAAAMEADLRAVLGQLTRREQELLSSHYGLEQGSSEMSLSEIGDRMGITKARVQQLEARALRRLRHLLEQRQAKLHKAAQRRA